MSDWWWPKQRQKKPPPAHGIKIKKAGTTWWGKRWIEVLEHVLLVDSGRLARGRAYARAGRTHDLEVKKGEVAAKVTGSSRKPYNVRMQIAELDAIQWTRAIAKMAEKVQFSAELLAGQMPLQIDDVFREVGVSLFPQRRSDLRAGCSCFDYGDSCKHVVATHYVLGEALDRDPFLLFELRGKTKDEVLEAMRIARGKSDGNAAPGKSMIVDAVPATRIGAITKAEYDKPCQALPALHFSFDAPADSGMLLRQLGKPTSWNAIALPADVFGPAIRAAAEKARHLALVEFTEPEAFAIDLAAGTTDTIRGK